MQLIQTWSLPIGVAILCKHYFIEVSLRVHYYRRETADLFFIHFLFSPEWRWLVPLSLR